jgi:hypothetical protein
MLTATVILLAAALHVDSAKQVASIQNPPAPVCGIKVVGYRFIGKPGQQFEYARERFTIPTEGYVELIAERRTKHYVVDRTRLRLDEDLQPLDAFGFRWITLPAPPAQQGGINE